MGKLTIFENCSTGGSWSAHRKYKEKPCANCLQEEKKYRKVYRQLHAEKVSLARRENYLRKREDRVKYSKEYRKNNPDCTIKYTSKRRAKLKNAFHSPYKLQEVLDKYGSKCHICNKEIDLLAPRKVGVNGWEMGLHLDHIVPLSKGGSDDISNVMPSHGLCNLRKKDKLRSK